MTPTLWFAVASLALGFIGACFSMLASVIAYFVKKGEEQQDREIQRLRDEVERAATTLARYESHIGAGDSDLEAIKIDLRDHVQREEQIFWKKVDALVDVQRVFSEAVLQRIASMEARLPKNGEIADLMVGMGELRTEMRGVTDMSRTAVKHVDDHNEEAEDWKRRIVALEAHYSRRTR